MGLYSRFGLFSTIANVQKKKKHKKEKNLPDDFMFQLSKDECLRSQIATSTTMSKMS